MRPWGLVFIGVFIQSGEPDSLAISSVTINNRVSRRAIDTVLCEYNVHEAFSRFLLLLRPFIVVDQLDSPSFALGAHIVEQRS